MEPSQFDKLEVKITAALDVIRDLKAQKQTLTEELQTSKEHISQLQLESSHKDEEIKRLKTDFEEKDNNISEAGERIQNLISKLEQENLEEALK